MAEATQVYGTTTPLTVTNLHSLGDDAFWQSDKITNAAVKGFWAEVYVTIVTTTGVGDANGVINLRMAASEDNTLFAGQLTGSEGSYSDTLNLDHRHTTPVASFPCDALEATARTYRYRAIIHDLPEFFAFLIENKSGQALASGSNVVEYRIHKYASA
jgi:hypothetical protein